jgi:diaminopimelate epimerase
MQNIEGYELINDDIFIDSGSPHLVKILKNISEIDILRTSRDIQKSKEFKSEGVNVNYVKFVDYETVQIRTYERGVEDETLSCGTGAVAAALSFSILSNSELEKVSVKTQGGDLFVEFKNDNNNFYDIYLSGKVKKVFSGEIDYEKN